MPPVVNLAGKHGTVFIHLKNQGHSLRQSDICFTTLNSRALSCPVYGCLTHLLGRNRNLTWILINEHLFIFFLFFFFTFIQLHVVLPVCVYWLHVSIMY